MSTRQFKSSIVGNNSVSKTKKKRRSNENAKKDKKLGVDGKPMKRVGGVRVTETSSGLFIPKFDFSDQEETLTEGQIIDEPVLLPGKSKKSDKNHKTAEDGEDEETLAPPSPSDSADVAFYSDLHFK